MLWILIGFISGSIPFSSIIARAALHTDMRSIGDGNPGATNVWKAGGLFWSAIAALLDGLKGAIPVVIAYYHVHLSGWTLYFASLAPLIGHLYSPFLKFRGGKGLATTFGIWLGLTLWIGPTLLGMSLFIVRKFITRDGTSVMAGMIIFIIYLLLKYGPSSFVAIALTNLLLVGWKYYHH